MRASLLSALCAVSLAAGTPPAEAPVLSLLAWSKTGWTWVKLDPLEPRETVLAKGEGTIQPSWTALSPDGTRGLVGLDPELSGAGLGGPAVSKPGVPALTAPAGAAARTWVVDLGKGTKEPLPPAPKGESGRTGFGKDGRVLHLGLDLEAKPRKDKRGEAFFVDGKRVPVAELGEGIPCLAVAHALGAQGWKRIEVKASTQGADYAAGVAALDAAKGMAPDSDQVLEAHAGTDELKDPAAVAELRKLFPNLHPAEDGAEGSDGWTRLQAAPGVAVWSWVAEFSFTSGAMAFTSGGKVRKPARWPFTDGDLVSYQVRGGWLLAAQAGTGAHPRLYELATGRLLWFSDEVTAATFWPGH